MADKEINDLQPIASVTDSVNIPGDNGTQSYRITALQFFTYFFGKLFTATGDLLYSSSGTTSARLAIGAAGQYLGIAAGVPAWSTFLYPGRYHFVAYYPGSISNYWSRSNASYGDPAVTGTIPTPTTVKNSNFGTLSKAASDFAGIAFTAPRTGTIKCTATIAVLPTQSNSASSWSLRLLESVTTTVVGYASGSTTNNTTNNTVFSVNIVGYFDATASTAYNFKVQSSNGVGTLFIGAANFETCLEFAFEYIT